MCPIDNNITRASMSKILHIRLNHLQISHENGMEQSYFSISHNQKHYFSSSFDDKNIKMEDDILIQLHKGSVPESIGLHRWENCMMVFSFQVEFSELKGRSFTKKKMETKHREYVSIEMQLYEASQMLFTEKYNPSIAQHYLIIQDLYFLHEKTQARQTNQPNYFAITTKQANYVLPLRQAVVLAKVPATLEIASFVNNNYNGKSKAIDYDSLMNDNEISIDKQMKNTGKVALKMKWAINLHRCQVDQNVLMQTNELMFYDFEFKLDNPADIVGTKFKVTHGSKAFDFAEDIDRSKITKIKKVVFFIVKSNTQEVDFTLHKLGKIIAHCRVSTSQISPNHMSILRKKIFDPVNPTKCFGLLKMRAEKGRNLSVPQANRYWRQVLRRKHSLTNMMVAVHQCSAYFPEQVTLALAAKVENEEKIIQRLPNLNFYDAKDEPSKEVAEFSLKGEESLYLIVKTDAKSNDFCGIGVVSTTELRLGINVCEVPFYKNQQKAGVLNCIVNKMIFWPFLKPLFQSEAPIHPHQPIWIDLFLNSISFTPYFYTYRYDSKEEVYCIVEVNKVKKVLILENTEHDKLTFFAAPGSDVLNYEVQQPDIIKVKISFLVSDLGHEEEIYGTASCKLKAKEIVQNSVKLKNIEIYNDYSVVLGIISLEASKGAMPKAETKNKTADNEKPSAVGPFDLSQASFDSNMLPQKSRTSARRYSGGSVNSPKPTPSHYLKKNTGRHITDVKLPIIKEKKHQDSFQDLLHVMKVRKRQLGGAFLEKGHSSSKKPEKAMQKQRHSFDLKKLQQSSPNIDRNLEILFPKKANDKYIELSRSRNNDYEERMKGLRSVMNQISDIGEVEPSVRESYPEGHYDNDDFEEVEPEWEGNEFAQR